MRSCTSANSPPVVPMLELLRLNGKSEFRLMHDDFCKDYFMDVLVARGLMVEVKTSESLIQPITARHLTICF